MSRNQQDRKFLHDLATPLFVVRNMIKRTIDEITGKKPNQGPEKQMERLEAALKAVEKMEALHAEQKSAIHSRESGDEKKAA